MPRWWSETQLCTSLTYWAVINGVWSLSGCEFASWTGQTLACGIYWIILVGTHRTVDTPWCTSTVVHLLSTLTEDCNIDGQSERIVIYWSLQHNALKLASRHLSFSAINSFIELTHWIKFYTYRYSLSFGWSLHFQSCSVHHHMIYMTSAIFHPDIFP